MIVDFEVTADVDVGADEFVVVAAVVVGEVALKGVVLAVVAAALVVLVVVGAVLEDRNCDTFPILNSLKQLQSQQPKRSWWK